MRNDGFEVIPTELLSIPNWVGVKFGNDEGRLTKLPINFKTGWLAASDDPSSWCDFDTALQGFSDGVAHGLMLRLPPGVGLIDFDKMRDVRTDPDINRFVRAAQSYTDYSPSGQGLHILFKTSETLPSASYLERFSTGIVEIFTERFCCMTSDLHPDSRPVLADLTDFIQDRFPKLFERKETNLGGLNTGTSLLSDDQIITKVMTTRHARNFGLLKDGYYSAINPAWSASEADLAYCCHLAFWTNGDVTQMDRLYRFSGLYRKKWEKASYRKSTINKALRMTAERYTGKV